MKRKKFTIFLTALLMLIWGGEIWGQTTTYEKATSISVGDIVLLVTETASKEFSSYSTTSTVYGIGVEYTNTPNGVYEFTVTAGYSNGSYAFKDSNNNYMYWASGNSLNKNATLSNNTSWTVEFDANNNAIIKNSYDSSRQIWWNQTNPRFACYTGKSADKTYYCTQLYKKSSSSSPTCTIDPTEYDFGTVGVGQQAQKTFTVTTANLTGDLTVSLYGYDESGAFSIPASSQTILQSATSTEITVNCNPSAAGELEELLVISGGGITDVEVDLTATAAWTVTASSNNDEWGTVVISDNSITATPNTGYTYAEPAYTVTPIGAATVEQVDNIFTVTPSANCNVQINFAESTTPVCTIDPTEYDFGTVGVGQQAQKTFTVTTANLTGNLTVSLLDYDGSGAFSIPASSQTILQSATSTEITVNCHPSAAGELEELLVISGDGITEVNVELTATAAPVYTVTFNPGSGTVTPASLSGVTINLSELTVTPPTGWTLYGWALEATDGATTSAPEIVSDPYTPTGNVTLYAVYMKEEEGTTTASSNFISSKTTATVVLESGKPITYKCSVSNNYENPARIYKNNNFTIEGATITDISLTGEASYSISNMTVDNGTLTTEGNDGVWKGNETTVIFTATNAQTRISAVSVTYLSTLTTYNSNPSANGPAATPTFSLAQESWYYSTQSLALSCSTDGATIYYTTDGTEPTASSTEYTAPISVSTTTTIKAIAYAENYDPSEIASATYNIMPNIARTCVIAYKDGDGEKYYAMSQTANGTRLKSVEVEPNEGVVTISANAGLLWTIENTTNGVAIRPYNTTDYLNIANQSLTITSTEDYFKVIESTNTTGTYHFQDLSSNYAIEYYNNLFTGYGLTIGGTAFEMYLLGYEFPTSYTITVLNDLANGSIACELETAAENDLVTVTVTPDEGYRLATLYYYTNDPESTTAIDLETKTFNMPAANVTIGATFEAIPHLTIVLHANGNTSNWDVEQNATVELPTPDAGNIPNGFTFIGWSTATVSDTDDEPVTMVASPYTPTEDITLYAVFAIASGNNTWNKVMSGNDIAGEYLIVYSSSNSYYVFNGKDENNGYISANASSEGVIDDNVDLANGIVEIATMDGGYSLMVKNGDNAGKYMSGTSDSNKLNFNNEAQLNTISINGGVATITSNSAQFKFNKASNNLRFRYYATGQEAVSLYKYYPKTITNYTTSVEEKTIDETISSNTTWTEPTAITNAIITIESGVTLTATAGLTNTNPANLVIEDGGQLIINNAGVQATVMKNFLEHGTYNKGEVPGWYFISSPVKDQAIQDFVDNATDGDYDLYKWVGSNKDEDVYKPWYNYKQHDDPNDFGSSFQTGIGYLAGYESSDEFPFKGELNYGDAYDFTPNLTYNGNIWECYALLGNPYSYALDWTDFQKSDVYDGFAIVNPAIGSYFYYSGTGIINPSQGFFVKTTGDDNLELRYNKGSHQRTQIDQIDVVVSSQNGIDNAIIRLEDESKGGFTKLDNFNSENPMLWLPVNDKEYAIASYSEGTVMVPVNFKAGTTAKYTIRMKATGQYSYLHLIDRLTGDDIDMLIEGEYSFIGSPRDNAERFIVKFNNNSNSDTPENDIFAYQNGDELFVTGNGTIQVFDVTGRFVQSKEVHGNTSMSISSLPKGVYIFRLIGSEIKTQKIVVR